MQLLAIPLIFNYLISYLGQNSTDIKLKSAISIVKDNYLSLIGHVKITKK